MQKKYVKYLFAMKSENNKLWHFHIFRYLLSTAQILLLEMYSN